MYFFQSSWTESVIYHTDDMAFADAGSDAWHAWRVSARPTPMEARGARGMRVDLMGRQRGGACGGGWRLCLILLTRLVNAITVVLLKVDFDNFCIGPETRTIRFDQIGIRLSQIVLPEFDWGCGTLRRGSRMVDGSG